MVWPFRTDVQRTLSEIHSQMKGRGRPTTSWMNAIQKTMSDRNLQPGDWEDRIDWKSEGRGRYDTGL